MVTRAFESARLVSLQRRDTRKPTAVEGVRRQRHKREKRNEKYVPGAFAFAQIERDGPTSCSADATSDGNERTIETESEEAAEQARQHLEAHRNAGLKSWRTERAGQRPQLQRQHKQQMPAELEAPKRKRYLELKMGDSDLERFRRDTNQRTSVMKT